MKLSWSHKLFLRINKKVGIRPKLDNFMRFCAKWLIFVLIILSLNWVVPLEMVSLIAIGYFVSILIGLLVRHPRPIVEFTEIKQLITPIGLWKSFPSDHTFISFTLAFLSFIYGAPVYFSIIMVLLACVVSVSRVYVGVHYPRDIVGGFVLACTLSLIFYNLNSIYYFLFTIF